MTYCGRCGTENPVESIFCWKCGAKLVKAEAETGEEAPPKTEPANESTGPMPPNEESAPITDELKPGFILTDENTVAVSGKTYDISPETRHRYRTYAFVLMMLGYIVGFLMYFAFEIRFENEILGSFSDSMYGIAIGDYSYEIAGTEFVIAIGITLLILNLTGICGILSGAFGIFSMFMLTSVNTVNDVIVGTVDIPFDATTNAMSIFIVGMILYIFIMIGACWCMTRYTLPYEMRKGSTTWGSLKAFYLD